MICRFCDKPAVQVIVDTLDDDHVPLCEACAAVAAYALACTDEAITAFEYIVLLNHPVAMTIEEFKDYEVAQNEEGDFGDDDEEPEGNENPDDEEGDE